MVLAYATCNCTAMKAPDDRPDTDVWVASVPNAGKAAGVSARAWPLAAHAARASKAQMPRDAYMYGRVM